MNCKTCGQPVTTLVTEVDGDGNVVGVSDNGEPQVDSLGDGPCCRIPKHDAEVARIKGLADALGIKPEDVDYHALHEAGKRCGCAWDRVTAERIAKHSDVPGLQVAVAARLVAAKAETEKRETERQAAIVADADALAAELEAKASKLPEGNGDGLRAQAEQLREAAAAKVAAIRAAE